MEPYIEVRMERGPDRFTTADLCDEFGSLVRVAEPLFKDYGGIGSFCGQAATVRLFEVNVLVYEAPAAEREGCWSSTAGDLPLCQGGRAPDVV